MLLAIDVGNTNIFLGIYKGEEVLDTFRLNSKNDRTADELGLLILDLLRSCSVDASEIKGAVLSSVVPHLTESLKMTLEKFFAITPVIIGPGVKTGINIATDNPKEVGADRLVNVAAAHMKYKKDCIIIDFGTATTFDYVDRDGNFKYTIIMPGLKLAADALFTGTAKLPDVELVIPDSILASNTVEGMQVGIMHGYLGAVKHIVEEQIKTLKIDPLVIATGGISDKFVEKLDIIDLYDPNLTLEGMKYIYKKTLGIKGDLD